MPKESSTQFYSKLPVLESFFEISDPAHYQSIPDDWYVGVTDIINSSKAINEEKYKWVNILGASPIIGIMNESKKADIPFSFGGDGCSVCFPPEYFETVKKVFIASKHVGEVAYGLELRTGIYPISEIRKRNYDVKIAKFKVSEFYNQAVFMGGGLNQADELLKSEPDSEFIIKVPKDDPKEVDFSGLECRWQEVKKENLFVYSILIQANESIDNHSVIYNSVFTKMREYFGFDDKTNPILLESLKMTLSPDKLAGETKFRTAGRSWYVKITYLLEVIFRTFMGKYFMKYNKKTSETDWSYYKPDMVLNNDHRKFDDMIRLVISCRTDQIEEFEAFLDEQYKNSKLAYGIHKSESALITCMVFAWHRQHIHFVDGSRGGYIMASKALKKRMDRFSKKASLTKKT